MNFGGKSVSTDNIRPEAVDQVDEERRSALFAMAKAMAYIPPIVATFAMGGLSIREAHAYGPNAH